MGAVCRIDLFGGLSAHVDGRVVSRFQTQKTGALLAYLAIQMPRACARESLAEILWPDGDVGAIRNRLNQAVSSLRRQVHPPGLPADCVIVATHHTLALNASAVTTDVDQFLLALRNAATATDPAAQIESLRAAISIYKGEFLSGYFEDWILPERLLYAEQASSAMVRLVRLLVNAGEFEEALEIANRRLRLEPDDEDAHVLVMRLYLKAGRPRAALRQFEELHRILKNEGIAPSPIALKIKLRAESILDENPVDETADLDAVNDCDLWESSHAAKRPGLAHVLDPSRTIRSPIGLPTYFSPFFGRAQELDRLSEWYTDDSGRILSVVGIGGIGKTRLLFEFANRIAESHDDKIVFLRASGVQVTKDIMPALAELCRVNRPNLSTIQALSEWIDGSRALIVLDEFEDHAKEDLTEVEQFLALNKRAKVVLGTRRSLGRSDELVIPLQPLPLPPLREIPLADLADFPSISLFVSRAQAAKQDFQLTERIADTIALLCRRLEGHPLAIELAASWARTMTPGMMAEEVVHRFDLLTDRRRAGNERHRSMQAVIDSCYERLSEEAQRFLCKIALIPGSWNSDLAAAVGDESNPDWLIDELEEFQLITSVGSGDGIRFGMLEIMRRFAQERLTPQDRLAGMGRLANYILGRVGSGFDGARELASLEESQNIKAANDHLIATGRVDDSCDLVARLAPHWLSEGLVSLGMSKLQKAIQSCDDPTPARIRAEVQLATMEWHFGAYSDSVDRIERLRSAVSTRLESREQVALDLVSAMEAHRRQEFERARDILSAVIETATRTNEQSSLEVAWRRLGNASVEEGKFDRAFDEYSQSLRIARESPTPEGLPTILVTLANFGLLSGQIESAESWLAEAENLSAQLELKALIRHCRLTRAQILRYQGHPVEALKIVRDLLASIDESNYRMTESLGICALCLSDIEKLEKGAQILGYLDELERRGRVHRSGISRRNQDSLRLWLQEKMGASRFEEQHRIGETASDRQCLKNVRTAIQQAIDDANLVSLTR